MLLLIPMTALPLRGDAGASASVTINNGFNPASLTIHPGDTVTWTNNDDRDHDVTAADGSYSSGNLKAGQTFSHTFAAAGKFPYACSLHPRERGVIVVAK